jgi:hypothetical protein
MTLIRVPQGIGRSCRRKLQLPATDSKHVLFHCLYRLDIGRCGLEIIDDSVDYGLGFADHLA